MFKKFLLIVIFFSGFHSIYAGVIINEIFYSPTSKQWIEIYNDSNDAIDLTQYKILDAGAAINGHGISLCSGLLSPNSYAIIAKVPEDFSNPTFALCKSALGIKSTAEDTVILKINSETVDTVLVPEGSAIGGDSFQLINGSWSGAPPTPGVENITSSNNENSNESSDVENNSSNSTSSNSSSSSSKSSKKTETVPLKPKLRIIAPKVVFINTPFELQSEMIGGEKGKYFWNFGDGNTKETKDVETFSHTYFYEGEYLISLEHFPKNLSKTPDLTAEVMVKVVPMSVSISRVGDQKDFFIELINNTAYEVNVSGWILSSLDKKFIFPRNTVILGKKKIILSPKVTNFDFLDKNNLKLNDQEGQLVFEYGKSLVKPKVAKRTTQISPTVSDSNISTNEGLVLEENIIPNEDLLAQTLASNKDNISYLWTLVALGLISISSIAVYFIRSKKISNQLGHDFDILDE
ncbi:lamin tail domain-containing protein [Candidatus Nomurabacteria bacterium]|nr:lamin tail domain-containing protein [Candidatus Nomurabacteria bacterium]